MSKTCVMYGVDCIRQILTYYPSSTGGFHRMIIDISDESDVYENYRDLSLKWCKNTTYGNEILYRKYYIMKDGYVTELTAREECKLMAIPSIKCHAELLHHLLDHFLKKHNNITEYYAFINGALYRVR